MRKWIKRGILAGILSSAMTLAATLAWIRPTLKELFSIGWYLDLPMKLIMKVMAAILPLVARMWGEEGVKRMQFILYEAGKSRSELLKKELHLDPDDARSIGRVIDLEDGMVHVKGVWTKETKGLAIKEERHCPATRELGKCPEVCTHLMTAMEAGTLEGFVPRMVFPKFTKLLSTGDDCCEVVLQLKPVPGSEKADKEESPHATHGAFPSKERKPVLVVKMAMAMGLGMAKGLLKALTTGPGEMAYYEDYRYIPEEHKR